MSLFGGVRRAHIFSCAFLLVVISNDGIDAGGQLPVVRVVNAHLAETLEWSRAVSPTVRALLDELEQSDLIIHVRAMPMEHRRHYSGAMRFTARSGGRRFLRIDVDLRLPREQRAAVLAHELQHAVEVARHEFVVDQASLAVLYQQIGYESGGAPNNVCFETTDARRIGALVLADVRAGTR
jgi:hypothetical protein